MQLDSQIALVTEHHQRVTASCAADVAQLQKEIEVKAREAETLKDKLSQVEQERTWIKTQWEQSQLSLERKYEKIFKSKPPSNRLAKQEEAGDILLTMATSDGNN